MVWPSTSSPVSSAAGRRPSRGTATHLHVLLLDAVAGGVAGLETGGQEEMGLLVAEAGAVQHGAEELHVAGVHPDLLEQLAPGRLLGWFAVDVPGAGGDLEQHAVDGPAVLAHEQDLAAVGDGHHGDGPGVADDVAGELGPVGGRESAPRSTAMRQPRSADLFAARYRNPGAGPPATVRRSRRSVASGDDTDVDVDVDEARQAALGPGQGGGRAGAWKSGWGRSGRLLNSGCAWVPTQKGWPGSSTNSTSRPSGETPEHSKPPFSRAGRKRVFTS